MKNLRKYKIIILMKEGEYLRARCRTCKQVWNISIKAKIPSEGYECPHCRFKSLKGGEKNKC